MRTCFLAAVAVSLATAGAATAQPEQPALPALEVRLRSINDLVGKGEYLVGLAGEDEWVTQFKAGVKQVLEATPGKGLFGIDPKKPFGAYMNVSLDVANSPITLMVPVADRDLFLEFLGDSLKLKFEKAERDTLTTTLELGPDNKVPVYLGFSNGYAYFARSVNDLDPKSLITPAAFFAKDDGAVASLVFRAERVPRIVRAGLLAETKKWVGELQKKAGADSDLEKAFSAWVGDTAINGVTALVDDVKEVRARVVVDETADVMTAEVTLVPKAGTALSQNFASLGRKTSRSVAIVSAHGSVAKASISVGMTDEMKAGFSKVVDKLGQFAIDSSEGPEKEYAKLLWAGIEPTLLAGELDAAVAFAEPDAQGRRAVIAAAKIAKAGELEASLKKLIAMAKLKDEVGAPDIKLDVEKVAGFNLHAVTFKDLPPEVLKFFGAKELKLWVAFSEDHVAFSFEADGSALKAGLKAKPVAAPAASLEVAMARVAPLFADLLPADGIKKAHEKVFGNGPVGGKDVIALTATGGDVLTVKLRVEGKAVRTIAELIRLAFETYTKKT